MNYLQYSIELIYLFRGLVLFVFCLVEEQLMKLKPITRTRKLVLLPQVPDLILLKRLYLIDVHADDMKSYKKSIRILCLSWLQQKMVTARVYK